TTPAYLVMLLDSPAQVRNSFEKIVRLLSLSFLFSEPDDVRLVGGGSRCAGGVEWYDQGEWRIVGSEDEDQRDVAAVVCRQLGCGSTVSVLPGNTTRGIRVYCEGSESSLRECWRSYDLLPGLTVICSAVLHGYSSCPDGTGHVQCDGDCIVCGPVGAVWKLKITESLSSSVLTTVFSSLLFTAELSVRLVNGTTSCSGTVLVFYRGEWSGLCPNWWSIMREVKVVCRELDCGNPVSESRGPLIEDGRGGVRLYGCSGDESTIRQCGITGGRGVCNGGYYRHVICSGKRLSVRLVDGAGLCSGRVEVKSNQSWASVCEADFDRQDAEVVCGELGCGAPAALQGGLYGEGEGQTWDKEFQCKGNESLLLDCDTSDRENNTCLPGNAVGLTCSEPDDVRLVGGAGLCSGRVEVKSNQSWASVCEADFDQQDAEVVCRELGCGAPAALQGGLYGEGEGQTWDKEFQCKGKESLLLDCDTSDRENNTCLPGNAVGFTCSGKKQFVTQSTFEKIVRLLSLSFLFSEPDDVRLVGGGSRCAGGVEWYDQGEWRTVGADWNKENVAVVVCRQLGCGSTVLVPPGNTNRGIGVFCSGSEPSLRECSRSYYLRPGLTVICSVFYGTTNTCQPQSITAVRITESLSSSVLTTVFSSLLFTAELSVRLVNGTTSCSGTVEVFYRGEWSGLCPNWWSIMREVKVVCRELDCGNPVSESRGPLIEDGRGGVRLYGCSGDESSIRQCGITGGRGVCNGGYYRHVICSDSVRLVDGAGLCSGRVEVKSNQSWASVCEADFDRQDAEVVCGELGCGAPAALQGGLYGEGEGQTWDKEFQCKGNEITESLSSSVLTTVFSSLLFTAELSVRLVDGTTSCSGTVEVFYEGEWLGLCPGWWDMMREIKVVCRELNCGNPVSVSRGPLFEDGRRGVILYSCSGDESSIRQCGIRGGPGFCDGRYYHHVTCSVEVKSNQSWASVCEADFDRQDAEVVCTEFGCGAPAALQGGLYGEGEGQTWDKEFQCKGKESLLLDCDTSDRENNTCLPGNAIGLTCSGKKQFVTQSTLFLTWSEEYERQYRCVLVRK
uniref:SRCR domain-containing protein n=1 Tax=Oncorhynchus kisutch TaxID=8019 RepID=A0A8C7HXU8_ONCKI